MRAKNWPWPVVSRLKLCKDDLHRAERGEAEEAVLITPEAPCLESQLGMGQNETISGPQVLVFVSIYQGSVLGTYF